MKLLRLLPFIVLTAAFTSGCATTSKEPAKHVARCHQSDGSVIASTTCAVSHDKIIAQREAERRTQQRLNTRTGGRFDR